MLVCTVGTARTLEPRVLKTDAFLITFWTVSTDVSVYNWNRAFNGTARTLEPRVLKTDEFADNFPGCFNGC